jgi:hypothetical protein
MKRPTKQAVQPLIAGICGIGLAFLLVACQTGSGPGGTTSTPTAPPPTLAPTPSPTPSPTPAADVTYKGNGYTIDYPKGWQVMTGSDGFVSFSDLQGVAYLAIRTQPNPEGAISSSQLVELGLQVFQAQARNYQRVDIAPTTKVGGETWSQGAATGDITPEEQNASVTVKTVVTATNHPPNALSTNGFTIAYGTDQHLFDQAKVSLFQPMLQSFTFT